MRLRPLPYLGEHESQGPPEPESDYTPDSDDHSVKSVVSLPTPAAPVQQENFNVTSEVLPDPVHTSAKPRNFPLVFWRYWENQKKKTKSLAQR